MRKLLGLLFAAFVAGSCAQHRSMMSDKSASNVREPYIAVTAALNQADWPTLRSLIRPEMRANESIKRWEARQQAGRALRVGKLMGVQRNAELDGKHCEKYSFT